MPSREINPIIVNPVIVSEKAEIGLMYETTKCLIRFLTNFLGSKFLM